MACTGSGVQIPSAPQKLVKFLYIKEIYSQTKELVGSQFFIAVISVLQVAFVVKELGVEKYGIVTLIITLPSLIFRATHSRNSDVTLLALNKSKNIFAESLLFDFLIGMLSLVVCYLGFSSELGTYFGIESMSYIILVYLFSRVIQTFSETSKAVLIFEGKMKEYSLLELITVLIRFLSILILLSINPTIESYLTAQIIYSATYGLFGIFLARKYAKIKLIHFTNLKLYFKEIKDSYSKLRLDQILGLIPQHLDVILLAIVSDLSSVGVYKFAKKLVEPINYIVVTFNPWLQNKLKNSKDNFQINVFFRKVLLPIGLILTVLYVNLGESLILLIGTEEFLESYIPMLILLIGFIFYLYTFWIRQYLLFNDLISYHAFGRMIYSVVFLVSSVPLSQIYSSRGIAIALSLAMVVQKLYEYTIYKKKLKS